MIHPEVTLLHNHSSGSFGGISFEHGLVGERCGYLVDSTDGLLSTHLPYCGSIQP